MALEQLQSGTVDQLPTEWKSNPSHISYFKRKQVT